MWRLLVFCPNLKDTDERFSARLIGDDYRDPPGKDCKIGVRPDKVISLSCVMSVKLISTAVICSLAPVGGSSSKKNNNQKIDKIPVRNPRCDYLKQSALSFAAIFPRASCLPSAAFRLPHSSCSRSSFSTRIKLSESKQLPSPSTAAALNFPPTAIHYLHTSFKESLCGVSFFFFVLTSLQLLKEKSAGVLPSAAHVPLMRQQP